MGTWTSLGRAWIAEDDFIGSGQRGCLRSVLLGVVGRAMNDCHRTMVIKAIEPYMIMY